LEFPQSPSDRNLGSVPAIADRLFADGIGERAIVEDTRCGIPNSLHEPAYRTMMRVRTIRAQTKGHHARARQRGERAVNDTNDLAEVDLIGLARETVATTRSSPAREQAVLAQLEKYRFEEFARYALRRGDVGDVHGIIVRICGHHEESAQGVFGFL
jgi:hypothetical protein